MVSVGECKLVNSVPLKRKLNQKPGIWYATCRRRKCPALTSSALRMLDVLSWLGCPGVSFPWCLWLLKRAGTASISTSRYVPAAKEKLALPPLKSFWKERKIIQNADLLKSFLWFWNTQTALVWVTSLFFQNAYIDNKQSKHLKGCNCPRHCSVSLSISS